MSEPMKVQVRLVAPADTVWTALTDASALRVWFAEHVEVDLPNTYRFWGRRTVAGGEPRQVLLHAQNHVLRFEWLGTTVAIGLTAQGDETVLSLTQTDLPTWDEIMRDQNAPLSLMQTFWATALGNLADYLLGRPVLDLVDYTSRELRVDFDIAAGPADVFDSLVDPDKFSAWFGARMEMEPRVGGRWTMGCLPCHVRVWWRRATMSVAVRGQ